MDMKPVVFARSARIGFVVPRVYPLRAKGLEQGVGQTSVLVPENADFPRPLEAIHRGRKGMEEEQERRLSRSQFSFDQARNSPMIGLEKLLDPGPTLALPQAEIAGYCCAVAHRWNGALGADPAESDGTTIPGNLGLGERQ